jgi:hypothetical protein
VLRVGRKILHPFAQQVLVQIEIAGRLRHRHAPIPAGTSWLSATVELLPAPAGSRIGVLPTPR